MVSVFLIWVAYFLHFPLRLGSYINGAVIYSLVIYFVIYQWVRLNKKKGTLHAVRKQTNSQVNGRLLEELAGEIVQKIIQEELYKTPDLTVKKLARFLNIQDYKLSEIINQQFSQNFSDFINHFRVREACRLLTDPDYNYLTIAGIANEVGYNSISVFNTAFKKIMNQTPSQYKKNSSR